MNQKFWFLHQRYFVQMKFVNIEFHKNWVHLIYIIEIQKFIWAHKLLGIILILIRSRLSRMRNRLGKWDTNFHSLTDSIASMIHASLFDLLGNGRAMKVWIMGRDMLLNSRSVLIWRYLIRATSVPPFDRWKSLFVHSPMSQCFNVPMSISIYCQIFMAAFSSSIDACINV
jgi:hypothetical protein